MGDFVNGFGGVEKWLEAKTIDLQKLIIYPVTCNHAFRYVACSKHNLAFKKICKRYMVIAIVCGFVGAVR